MRRDPNPREYKGLLDDAAFAMWRSDLLVPDEEGATIVPAYRKVEQWLKGASLSVIGDHRRRAGVARRIFAKPNGETP